MKNLLFLFLCFFVTNVSSQCLSGDCSTGFGVKKYQDGTIYIGEWWNEVPSGKGTVIWPDGTIYVGRFSRGMYNGNGTLMTDKSLYIGEFYEDLPNGYGTLFTNIPPNMYVGNFEEGLMDGRGILQHDNNLLEEGIWEQGKVLGDTILKRENYILRGLKK